MDHDGAGGPLTRQIDTRASCAAGVHLNDRFVNFERQVSGNFYYRYGSQAGLKSIGLFRPGAEARNRRPIFLLDLMARSIRIVLLAAAPKFAAYPASSQSVGATQMNDGYAIEQQVHIEATAGEVWSVLVTPGAIQEWLGVKVVSDWQVGSAIDFNFEYEGKTFNDKGKIIAFSPNQRFAYSYWSAFSGLPDHPENYSEITLSIGPSDHGVTLSLAHTKIATKTMYKHSQVNWTETLIVIKKMAEHRGEV
ncbi:MAG: SRPBCC domain-containing protein [Usitatibacteraceae bacterium]